MSLPFFNETASLNFYEGLTLPVLVTIRACYPNELPGSIMYRFNPSSPNCAAVKSTHKCRARLRPYSCFLSLQHP